MQNECVDYGPKPHDAAPQSLELVHEAALAGVSRGRSALGKLPLNGRFHIEHLRDGVILGKYDITNDITNEGKNLLFDVMFNDVTHISNSAWAIGLISITSYSALAAGDTMASHGGWTEFIAYSQSTRVAWGSGTAASQSVTNASPATFDINGSGTVKGIFVTSQNSKSGSTGKLWSTALFSADVPVTSGDQLRITYTVSA